MAKIKVVFFHRKPVVGSFSVEYIFEDVRSRLSDSIEAIKFVCTRISTGFINRLYNVLECSICQGDINHVTGDIHFVTLLMRKKKTVLTILDCVFMEKHTGIKRWILKTFWLDLPVNKSSIITAISEATKQEIIKYTNCHHDKIKVVPVAISEKFKRVDKVFNDIKPVILHIGMAPNKNLTRLIEAIEGLNVHLSIVGKLNEEYISKLNSYNIDYSNAYGISDEEMLQKYIDCDVMSFVSTYEGFGMPILEAQSTGRVVVTSDVSSMPEVGGNAAHFVDPLNVASIRSGILKVINDVDYRNDLISKGFENIKRYDPQYIANMYEKIYHELYNKNRNSQ